MADILKAYVTARTELLREKTVVETRLQEITRALGDTASAIASSAAPKRRGRPPKAKAVAAVTDAKPKKRKMSAAARAAISAAAKARWAKVKAAGKKSL